MHLNEIDMTMHENVSPDQGFVVMDIYGDKASPELYNYMFSMICYMRAIHLWFHGAHHLTRGTSFSGDHSFLYDKVYTEVNESIDGVIEKGIGLCGPEVACPCHIVTGAAQILGTYPSPSKLSATGIAAAGMCIIKDFINFLEKMNAELDQCGALTLGLSDELAAIANVHEGYYYLLKQRASEDLSP